MEVEIEIQNRKPSQIKTEKFLSTKHNKAIKRIQDPKLGTAIDQDHKLMKWAPLIPLKFNKTQSG